VAFNDDLLAVVRKEALDPASDYPSDAIVSALEKGVVGEAAEAQRRTL
jgi:hypothetical protein